MSLNTLPHGIPGFANWTFTPEPQPLPGSGRILPFVRLVHIDCQSEGTRPGTALVAFDFASTPVGFPGYDVEDEQYGGFFIEPTREELVALIADLQSVLDASTWGEKEVNQ